MLIMVLFWKSRGNWFACANFRRDHADSTRSFFGQMRLQHEDGITAKAFSTPKQAHSAGCTKLRWNAFVKSGPPT